MTIGYLGPEGTFSHEAVEAFGLLENAHEFRTFGHIFTAIDNGEIDEAFFPIENLLEGTVREVMDGIYDKDLFVSREYIYPIHHVLASREVSVPITSIASHPQAYAQCKKQIQKRYSDVPFLAQPSTASGMELVSKGSNGVAAIGSKKGAEINGLKIREDQFEDFHKNRTRFWKVSKTFSVNSSDNKFTLAFYAEGDKPGLLWNSLGFFAEKKLNIISINSRPLRSEIGEYRFHLDVEGNMNDQAVIEVLNKLREYATEVRIMGSYDVKIFEEAMNERS